MKEKIEALDQCKNLIENKLGWGNSTAWNNQDFENLSQEIFAVTGLLLSGSTLKRLWGKVKYESKPKRVTLDALAQFIDYANWLAFAHRIENGSNDSSPESPNIIRRKPFQSRFSKRMMWMTGIPVLAFFMAITLIDLEKAAISDFSKVKFTATLLSNDLPNTVLFHYDVRNMEADSVHIQQSWMEPKPINVIKNLTEYTGTYYYPGPYTAKLFLNDQLAKEEKVIVETNGWTGLIEQAPHPYYLPEQQIKEEMAFDDEDYKALGIDHKKEPVFFSLYNVSKKPLLKADNFTLKVKLQNTYQENIGICQKTWIVLMGTNGMVTCPLSKLGCVGELRLKIAEETIEGKTHDLSGFGVDFSKAVSVKISFENGKLGYWVDEHKAYEKSLTPSEIGQIVGILIRFTGAGKVFDVVLK